MGFREAYLSVARPQQWRVPVSRASRTPKAPKRTLEERFADCHESFRAMVTDLATLAGKTWQEVYGLWREYSEYCTAGDQSAVWPEFVQWNAAKLGVNARVALGDAN